MAVRSTAESDQVAVLWVLDLVSQPEHLRLAAGWAVTLGLAVLVMWYAPAPVSRVQRLFHRKIFHLLALVLFVPVGHPRTLALARYCGWHPATPGARRFACVDTLPDISQPIAPGNDGGSGLVVCCFDGYGDHLSLFGTPPTLSNHRACESRCVIKHASPPPSQAHSPITLPCPSHQRAQHLLIHRAIVQCSGFTTVSKTAKTPARWC